VLWYVLDLMDYLDPDRLFFSQEDRKWARNNKEYVAWAFLPSDAVVYWSTWEELISPDIGFLPRDSTFTYWYTLYRFESHTPSVSISAKSFVEKVLKFAKQCIGDTLDTVRILEIATAALETGNWGYSTEPHLNSSTFRSLILEHCGMRKSGAQLNEAKVGHEKDIDKLQLDLSRFRIGG
jgi:hypothetical protein